MLCHHDVVCFSNQKLRLKGAAKLAARTRREGNRARWFRPLAIESMEDRCLLSTVANDLIAFSTERDGNSEIYAMNPDGSAPTNLTNNGAGDNAAAWSPDRSKIAFYSDRDGNSEIYVMNADGSGQARLTNDAADDLEPAWSPDGGKIAFSSSRDGNFEIYIMNADGTAVTRLTNSPAGDRGPAWSPDGSQIAFSRDAGGVGEIYVMNADGSGLINLTNNAADDHDAAWLPGGSQISFTSLRDGQHEIYLMNADGTGQTNLSNNPAADTASAWSPDGGKLAFTSNRDGNGEIYVMNADGSGQTNLSLNSANDHQAAWGTHPQQVQIDIKPGSDPNSINLASQGVIAVAIHTTPHFDASQVDVASVVFAGATPVHSALEDVDGDEDADLVLHFHTQQTNLRQLYEQLLADDQDSTRKTTEVTLTGKTVDDVLIEGLDALDLFLSGHALRTLLDAWAASED